MLEEEGGGYSVDIMLAGLPDGKRIILEVDGPSHFLRSHITPDQFVVSGSTCIKHRHLKQMGWEVVQVPYFKWDCLKDEETRASYVRDILKPALGKS